MRPTRFFAACVLCAALLLAGCAPSAVLTVSCTRADSTITAHIANVGRGDAGPIVVTLTGSPLMMLIRQSLDGLAAGETVDVVFDETWDNTGVQVQMGTGAPVTVTCD